MRIAINCRSFLKKQYAGIGRYAYNLVKSLSEIDDENEYLLYVRKGIFDTKRTIPHFSTENFSTKVDFFNQGLNKTLSQVDLYHSPSPDFIQIDNAKIIVTVHDLVYKAFPSGHTPETIETTHKQFEQIVHQADKIICCSQSTINDLKKYFPMSDKKTTLVYQGVDKDEFYSLDEEEKESARQILYSKGLKEPFILFVGTNEPRKNLENLVRAFALLKDKKKFHGRLVVTGMQGWMSDHIFDLIHRLRLKEEVILLGYVENNELRYLYNCAEVFVFPSLYEGFGFPILEALSCGAAVVTSNVSSCPEIAGEGAVIIDPRNPEQIAEAIQHITEDKVFTRTLKAKALKRAQDFSFLNTAKQTLKVYNETVNQNTQL